MPDLTLNTSSLASHPFSNISLFDSLIQCDLEDPQLRMCGWEKLKEKAAVGPLNIPMMMRQVEQMVLNTGRRPCNNVNELFEKFAARLAPEFEIAQVPEAARQITELQLSALQELLRDHYENTALETMWNACLLRQFQAQGAFAQEAFPSGHQAIREWLNNPANQPRIQQITQFEPAGLGLIGLGLKALPPEIGLFTGLTFLNLSGNQLSFLPESFGNLQALEWLNLSGSHLSFLPESFGNLQALTYLDLSKNQLSFLPDSFGSLKTLSELYLNQNRLSFLPDSFGSLQKLHHLFLENNQLRNLPDSFGNLRSLYYLILDNNILNKLPDSFGNLQALISLYLNNNQLSSLPESFGNLKDLKWLNLSDNQLSYLPESFGNLQALRVLDLPKNHLSYLPESFGNLQALTVLDLDNNPWMLVSDKGPYKITDYATYLARLEPLKKYTPQSPLATLFQAIIFNKPVKAIQQAYFQLSPKMQQWIAAIAAQHRNNSGSAQPIATSSSSDSSPSQDSLFSDMGLFARSVRKATYDLYESLEPEHKKLVHWHVWDLAGRSETDDSNWGENHVFDHVLRFTDALERATIG